MKKLPAFALSAAALPLLAATPFTRWTQHTPLQVAPPLMLDSVDFNGSEFTPESVLGYVRSLPSGAKGATLSCDSVLTLTKTDATTVRRLVTAITAPRYAEGNIVIETPLAYEVLIDSESRAASEKSGPKATIPVKLSPQRTYTVEVRLVTQPSDSLPSLAMRWEPAKESADVAVSLGEPQRRRFTLDDTMFGPRASSVQISPDGRWLLTAYADMTDVGRTLRRTLLTDLSTGLP